MISRYRIFCQVAELGSFTRAAEQLGYSQSAVSQTVRSVEQELGVTLLERRKDGVRLTADAEQYYPYLRAIAAAENALHHKQQEMEGLENSVIRIGTFTSVSRTLLPPLMKRFKEQYPSVRFVLRQGEYTGIARWLREGSIDFGFVCAAAVTGMETCVLYEDEMMAVLPEGHPLAKKSVLTLEDLLGDPLIVLDEGEYSLALTAFEREGLSPDAAYTVYDDYTILAMVRQGLGVSLLYEKVLSGFEAGLAIRPFVTAPAGSWRWPAPIVRPFPTLPAGFVKPFFDSAERNSRIFQKIFDLFSNKKIQPLCCFGNFFLKKKKKKPLLFSTLPLDNRILTVYKFYSK